MTVQIPQARKLNSNTAVFGETLSKELSFLIIIGSNSDTIHGMFKASSVQLRLDMGDHLKPSTLVKGRVPAFRITPQSRTDSPTGLLKKPTNQDLASSEALPHPLINPFIA